MPCEYVTSKITQTDLGNGGLRLRCSSTERPKAAWADILKHMSSRSRIKSYCL